jgi:hypothetical protein
MADVRIVGSRAGPQPAESEDDVEIARGEEADDGLRRPVDPSVLSAAPTKACGQFDAVGTEEKVVAGADLLEDVGQPVRHRLPSTNPKSHNRLQSGPFYSTELAQR